MAQVEIDWTRAIGGALAAVASAFLLSTLGAAGTIIGAAIGSIVVTVGSAYFSEGISSGRRSLSKSPAETRQKVGIAEAEVSRAARAEDPDARDSHLDHAGERLSEANRELEEAAVAEPGWRQRLAGLPWRRISWVSAGLFAAALLIITAIELIVGEPVSAMTGGTSGGSTTIGDVRPSGGHHGNQPTGSPSPSPSAAATAEPSASGSSSAAATSSPSPTPTDTASPTATTSPEPVQTASP